MLCTHSVYAGVCVHVLCLCMNTVVLRFLRSYASTRMWMLAVSFGGLFNHACIESYLVI